MASARQVAANRINSRKSRGPRTAAGKAASCRNAFRHGLAVFSRKKPALFRQIEVMAKAICQGDNDPLLFEQALLIAENELLLLQVRAQRIAVIERLRDPQAIALAKGDNFLALGRARSLQFDIAAAKLAMMEAELAKQGKYLDDLQYDQPGELMTCANWPAPPLARDEYEAMRMAMPDLGRLSRYERRAWSRRKRAVRKLTAIRRLTRL